MADIAELGIKVLSGDIVKATKRLDKLEKQSKQNVKENKKLSNSFKGLGTTIGALGLGLAFKSIISLAIEQERVVKQLDAAIKSTGGSAGFTTKELQKMAAGFQEVTNFGDEAIISAQSILLTFTNLKDDVFPATTQAVLDLSERMGTDLKSSAIQLGKALNDPIANLSALSRSGIQFSEAQKATIKSLVETNRLADAQTLILKELDVQFGGSAKAARDTFGGAIKSLGNAFGDLLEGDGGNLNDAKKATEELIKILQSDSTKQAFGAVVTSVVSVTTALVKGAVALNNFGTALGAFLAGGDGTKSLKELNNEIRNTEHALRFATEKLEAAEEGGFLANLFTSPEEIKKSIREITVDLDILKMTRDRLAEIDPVSIVKDDTTAAFTTDTSAIDREAALDAAFEKELEIFDAEMMLIDRSNAAKEYQLNFEKDLLRDRLNVAKGFLGNMSTLMASSSKSEFKIGKDFAIANALIKGGEAVVSAYAAGAKIHPAVGVAFAASAAAATKVQIDNIKSQQFGGGGSVSVSSGAGGGVSTGIDQAPAALPDAGKGGGVTNIQLVGQDQTFTGDQLDSIFDEISNALERGDKVLFTSESRQALELSA